MVLDFLVGLVFLVGLDCLAALNCLVVLMDPGYPVDLDYLAVLGCLVSPILVGLGYLGNQWTPVHQEDP